MSKIKCDVLYMAIGIDLEERSVCIIGFDSDREVLKRKAIDRVKDVEIEYFDILNRDWINDFQWWVSQFGITSVESKELAKGIIELLIRRHHESRVSDC